MTDTITISRDSRKSTANQGSWQLYLVGIGLLVNAVIWSSALLYLKVKKPTYTSTLTATLPGAGSAANVSLPNIGQASYQSSSPYENGSSQDPRETYKIIATSEPVIKAAAEQLNMPLGQFGQPRVNIMLNTTVMTFEFKGASPEEARNKSLALYKSFQARLNELRAEENVQRDGGFQSALSSSREKLELAQKRLSRYKADSGLNSDVQIRSLSDNIEQLRRQRAELIAQQQQSTGRLGQLTANLTLTSQGAADAFALQTDQPFQQNLKDYSEASGEVAVLSSKFLPDHPRVVEMKAKQEATAAALLSRGEAILGRPVTLATLRQLSLSSTNAGGGSNRDNLFQEVVKTKADQQGFQAQAQGINQQIMQLEARLKILAQQESTLDALKRDQQVAEAVFSSTLTRLDIGRSNGFGSYPLIQVLAEPNLSETPTSPKKQFVLLGAALGSVLSTTGLVGLWWRQRRRERPEQERRIKRIA